jgi:hypothetical protein
MFSLLHPPQLLTFLLDLPSSPITQLLKAIVPFYPLTGQYATEKRSEREGSQGRRRYVSSGRGRKGNREEASGTKLTCDSG